MKDLLINHLNRNQTDAIKCGRFELTRKFIKEIPDQPDKMITIEDVKSIIKGKKGRKSYYTITINEVNNDR